MLSPIVSMLRPIYKTGKERGGVRGSQEHLSRHFLHCAPGKYFKGKNRVWEKKEGGEGVGRRKEIGDTRRRAGEIEVNKLC